MLDRLPPAIRHLLILVVLAPLLTAGGSVIAAVLAAGTVYGLDWAGLWSSAVDLFAVGAASGVSAWITLYVTPLTRQYGVGQTPVATVTLTQDPWTEDAD